MTDEIATVWHEGHMVLVHQSVLAELGLTPGQTITFEQLGLCLEGNAAQFSAAMAKRRAAGLYAPDCTALDARLAERRRNRGTS